MNIQNLENKNVKIIFLLLLLLISFSRSPFLFLEGRFIGEEAVHFFKYSYFNEWYKTLFYIEGISGYYYLTANINAIFANLLPISKAPLATVYGSLIILFLIFLITLNTSSFLFKNIIDKYLGCLIVLLSPPFVAEIWLNSINTQVYLGILTIIILLINFEKNENKIVNNFTPLIQFSIENNTPSILDRVKSFTNVGDILHKLYAYDGNCSMKGVKLVGRVRNHIKIHSES